MDGLNLSEKDIESPQPLPQVTFKVKPVEHRTWATWNPKTGRYENVEETKTVVTRTIGHEKETTYNFTMTWNREKPVTDVNGAENAR